MPWRTDPHPTENIAVKTADVDVEMVTIIKWLNSFDWLTTISCCQGCDEFPPYVTFWAYMDSDLVKVVEKLSMYGQVGMDIKNGQLRYRMDFKDEETRNRLTNTLQRKHEKEEESE